MPSRSLPVTIDLHVAANGELHVALEIFNSLEFDLQNWTAHLDFPKSVVGGNNTRLLSRAGSHLRLAPADNAPLLSGHSLQLQLIGERAIIRRLTDLPDGLYLRSGEKTYETRFTGHNLATLPGVCHSPDYGALPGSSSPALGVQSASTPESASDKTIDKHCPLIPRPADLQVRPGQFCCPATLAVQAIPEAQQALDWLADMLPPGFGLTTASNDNAGLLFEIDPNFDTERYQLDITSRCIVATASGQTGFFYAMVSLLQLINANTDSEIQLPLLTIKDQPRFDYRGLMLDCSRQFHSKDVILRYLDLMALYKLNHFHWHLTDDEGWRIEIIAFPELTSLGAWRGQDEVLEPQFGSGPYRHGGFYSQQDVREIIEYASRRQIVVIPEMDIPGHSRAAIKSLPELLVEQEDSSHYCSVQLYDDNVLNPALPGTYQFLHAVLDEVCELFPGPYVHIGADEVPEGVWDQSPACQAMMAQQGYENTLDLQGHLLRNLQDYLADKGRQLVGWEEAAHGDKLDHSAIICAWSGVASAVETANIGYRVIACPAPFAYLDLAWDDNIHEPGFHWAGTATLQTCYAYDPHNGALSEQAKDKILGIQAVLWSELLATPERLEYMTFPRAFAIAETAWSPRESKDWESFQQRVSCQLKTLSGRGINCRPYDNHTEV
ncbi:MAG: beta-N-acetylhexosaminidase [Halioglobus sp.]